MFLGHFQVLFYARLPNSQLLFGELGIHPYFRLLTSQWDFKAESNQKVK